MLPDIAIMEAYIRRAALARGIDPDTAVAVARSEGLAPGVWQANGNLSYGRERSYGPFQLHVAPQGYRGGMGNDMIAQTGIDPSKPENWQAGVDFALNGAARNGWGAWYGAKKIGVTGMMGINGGRTLPVSTGQATQPGAYTAGEYVPEHSYTTYAPNVQPAGGPPPVPAQNKRTAYTDMMQRSIEKGSPANEARQQIDQIKTPGGGFDIPGLSALAGGKGGAGGKSGGGASPRFTPATPPPAAGPPEIPIPGGDLPVGPTPQLSPPTQGPFPAPAYTPPTPTPKYTGALPAEAKKPYFDTVDSAEGEEWNSGLGSSNRSPGGVPYDPKGSPLWDPRLKKFVPRLRPDVIG